jgi:hypothetical protein
MCKSAFLIASFLIVLFCPSAISEQKDDGTVWNVVFQIGYAGRCKGYITKDRLVFSNGIVRYLFVPPDYDQLLLISDESKAYMKMPLDKWLIDQPKIQWVPWKTIPATDSARYKRIKLPTTIKCDKYTCSREYGRGTAYFVATRTISTNTGIWKACCKFCGAPIDKGMPILFIPTRDINCARLQATFVDKAIAPPGVFSIPRSYRKTNDIADLYLGNDIDVFFQSRPLKKD